MTHTDNIENNKNDIDSFAAEFSSIDNPSEISKNSGCGNLPLIPILPVRYGLSLDYTTNATNGNISDIPNPSGIDETQIHWIQRLRQGFVYIYAPDGHHDISTDMKGGKNSGGNWLVFRYATNTNDENSNYKFEDIDTNSVQQAPHFFLYSWGEKGAAGEWKKHTSKLSTILDKSTAFVHQNTSKVEIAYSEYPWPAELFNELSSKPTLREKLMVKLDTQSKSISMHTGPINLAIHKVREFSSIKVVKLIEKTIFRHTLMVNEKWKGINPHFNENGFMVVLPDSLGEIKELQACHANILDKITKCDLEYQYPLTIGTLIDPTTVYEATNSPIPKEFNEERIKQKITEQYQHLVPNFRKRLIELIKEKSQIVEKYEKDLEKIIKQITKLHQRNDILPLLKTVRGIAEEIFSEPLACLKAHQFSCYIIADSLAEIPTSAVGSQYLLKRFSEPKSDKEKAKENLDTIQELSDTISDIIKKAEEFTELESSKRQKIEKRIYQSISILMTKIGTVFMFAAANSPHESFIIDRSAYFRLFGLDYTDLRQKSYAYLYEYTHQFKKRVRRMKLHLTHQPSESIGALAQQKITNILNHDIAKNTNAAFASLGLFLSFTSFVDVNDKNRSTQMLARSTIGKYTHFKWIELPKTAIEFTIETVEAVKIISNASIFSNTSGARVQLVTPLFKKLSTQLNRSIPIQIQEFKYTNNVLMLMGAVTFGVDSWEDYLDGDYISMSGNAISGIGLLLAAFGVISFGWGALLAFIGQFITGFGYDDFEDWLRTSIWGNSREYLNKNRADIGLENIIKQAKVLSNPNANNFILIKDTFSKELSDFNVLTSSLVISESKEEAGIFTISCNDFANNKDGQLNLTITYDYSQLITNTKGAKMPNKGNSALYYPTGETAVEVDLREKIKQLKTPIKLNVRYITTFDTKLTKSYSQNGYIEESIYKPAPF